MPPRSRCFSFRSHAPPAARRAGRSLRARSRPCSPKSPGSRNSPNGLSSRSPTPVSNRRSISPPGRGKRRTPGRPTAPYFPTSLRAVTTVRPALGSPVSTGIIRPTPWCRSPFRGWCPASSTNFRPWCAPRASRAAGAVTSACSVRASGSARRPSWVPTAGRAAACSSSPRRQPPSSGAA